MGSAPRPLAQSTVALPNDAALAAIAEDKLNAAWFAPVMTTAMLTCPTRDSYDVSSLAWAIGGGEKTPEARIEYAFRRALARKPRADEEAAVLGMLRHFEVRYEKDPKAAAALLAEGESPVNAKLQPSELAAYTTVASLLMNLDEMVTKE